MTDFATDLFRPLDHSTDLPRAICEELSDIHRGLCFQKGATSTADGGGGVMLLNAKQCFEGATRLWESSDFEIIPLNSFDDYRYLRQFFNMCPLYSERMFASSNNYSDLHVPEGLNPKVTASLQEFNDLRKQRKGNGKEHSTAQTRGILSIKGRTGCQGDESTNQIKATIYEYFKHGGTTVTKVLPMKHINGKSPTVNISWFLAKAYLANLSYTAEQDWEATLATCDDIISVYMHSLYNKQFAEETLAFVLSTEWAAIFDRQVQAVLGFYSLCSFFLNKSGDRAVCLGVCPVLFAHYLKLCVLRDKDESRRTRTSCYELLRQLEAYNEHFHACTSDYKVNNGRWILYAGYVHLNYGMLP